MRYTTGDNKIILCQSKLLPAECYREAVTLMEVIFAIGVILTGLVGLAALIPVAANNAQAVLEMDRSIGESTSASAAGLARQFNMLNRLVLFDKEAAGSTAIPGATPNNYGYEPTGELTTVAFKLSTQDSTSGVWPLYPTPGGPRPRIAKLESPGFGHNPLNADPILDPVKGLYSGLCLDPIGTPDPQFATLSAGVNAFDYSRFPYYSERYNVLGEPNASAATGVAAPGWPMSPRMYRVTLRSPDVPPTAPLGREHLMNTMALQQIFGGFGSIERVSGNEDGDPSGVLINRSRISGAIIDTAASNASTYSWFATLSPDPAGGNPFKQSIVVVRQRLAPVPQRSGDPLALNTAAYTVADAEENPSSERITWIDPGSAIGFNGGAGGDVLVYGSNAVSDDINTNEWVMLSRQRYDTSVTPNIPTGAAIHRWFRVLRVEEAERGTVDASYAGFPSGGSISVWRRWVTLAGSDWAFDDGVADQRDDTFCTIVTGAVSVIESEVELQ